MLPFKVVENTTAASPINTKLYLNFIIYVTDDEHVIHYLKDRLRPLYNFEH